MKRLSWSISSVKKISTKQQSDYLLLLGKLIGNGFSLKQAINCLCLLDTNKKVFLNIYQDLEKGQLISYSLRHLQLPPVIFNQLIIAQSNGNLYQTLIQSGQVLKNKVKQQNKLKELLVYPSFVLIFLFLMLLAMKLYIIPQLGMGSETRFIDLFLSCFFGGILFIVGTGLVYSYYLSKLSEYDRAQRIIRIPIIKKAYLNFYQFILLQGFGMQIASGLNLQKICQLNQNFKAGSLQSTISKNIYNSLLEGKSPDKFIDQEKILPKELKAILQLGGSNLDLAQDLLLISELKYEATKKQLKQILNLVQPVMFGFIAIIIIVTYLSVLLPVYGMMKGMS